MIDSYVSFLIRRRWIVMFLVVALTAAAVPGLDRLRFSNDYRDFFKKDNAELLAFQDLEKRYAKNNNVFIAVSAANGTVVTKDNLSTIYNLTRDAWALPHVTRVDSLTNFSHVRGDGEQIKIRELVKDPSALTPEELTRLDGVIRGESLIHGHMVAKDLSIAGVNVTVGSAGLTDVEKPKLMASIGDLLIAAKKENPNVDFYVTGSVAIDHAFDLAAQRDVEVLVPIMYLVLLLVALLVLRSIAATVGTVLVITMSVLVALGVTGYLDIPITAISVAAPTIIMTLALCHCMHIALDAMYTVREGKEIKQAIADSLRDNFNALLVTTFTTVVGFASMGTGEVPPIGDMGIIVSIGMVAAYLFSISFFPSFMATFLKRVPPAKTQQRAVTYVVGLVTSRPRTYMVAYLAVAVVCIAFITRNEINDNFVEYFAPSVNIRKDSDEISRRLTGLHQVYYSLPAAKAGGIFEPEYLEKLDKFVGWAREQKGVRHVYGISDTIRRINREINGGDPKAERVAASEAENAQYFLLYETSLPAGMDVTDRVDENRSATRVVVTVDNLSSREILDFDASAQRWLEANMPTAANAQGSGPSVMFAHIGQKNALALITGNMVAWGLVAFLMFIAFKSFRLAMLGMFPNTIPQFIAFGIWGLVDGQVGLAISTVTIMTFGIIEDDTVHSISKYVRARRHLGLGKEKALSYTLEHAGTNIVSTSLVLGLGFLVLAFSDFRLNAGMGVLTAVVIFTAMLADIFLLPGLLVIFDRKDEKAGAAEAKAPVTPAELQVAGK